MGSPISRTLHQAYCRFSNCSGPRQPIEERLRFWLQPAFNVIGGIGPQFFWNTVLTSVQPLCFQGREDAFIAALSKNFRAGSCCRRCHAFPGAAGNPLWCSANVYQNDAILFAVCHLGISPSTRHPRPAALSWSAVATSPRHAANTGPAPLRQTTNLRPSRYR